MNDAVVVRGHQRLGKMRAERQRITDWHGAALDDFGERLALDVLHHDVDAAVGRLAHFEDRADAWVVERRGSLGFPQQPAACIVILDLVRQEELDGDLAAELEVVGKIHLAHAAAAQQINQPVARRGYLVWDQPLRPVAPMHVDRSSGR